MAIVIALLSMLLLSVLGAALVMTTTTETLIAGNFRSSIEAQYAAEAVIERALDDLAASTDWSAVLGGLTVSGFTDGPPSGLRTLADGPALDLDRVRNMLNCRKATTCTALDLIANTPGRPWATNNPDWQLFAYGPVAGLTSAPGIDSNYYAVVLVGDDPSENDGDPRRDGADDTNPGTGVLQLRGEAFGPRRSHQVVELTVARWGTGSMQVVSWSLSR